MNLNHSLISELLEHCPECSRSGVVLAPEISRLKGEAPKGCGAAMAKVMEGMEE